MILEDALQKLILPSVLSLSFREVVLASMTAGWVSSETTSPECVKNALLTAWFVKMLIVVCSVSPITFLPENNAFDQSDVQRTKFNTKESVWIIVRKGQWGRREVAWGFVELLPPTSTKDFVLTLVPLIITQKMPVSDLYLHNFSPQIFNWNLNLVLNFPLLFRQSSTNLFIIHVLAVSILMEETNPLWGRDKIIYGYDAYRKYWWCNFGQSVSEWVLVVDGLMVLFHPVDHLLQQTLHLLLHPVAQDVLQIAEEGSCLVGFLGIIAHNCLTIKIFQDYFICYFSHLWIVIP